MFNERIYNFSAGPSMLPVEVLEKAQAELLNYGGTGTSVMEMSHRSKAFEEIIAQTEADFREVMHIPDNYKVLFLQGGATLEFAAIPMNLLKTGVADYVRTGQFSTKCYKEAQRFSDKIHLAASSDDKTYSYIPQQEQLDLTPGADYLHICFSGITFPRPPVYRLWQICLPASCRSLWMFPSSASFMPAYRRTSPPRAWQSSSSEKTCSPV